MVRRHKKKLIVTTGVVAVSYFVTQYVSSKVNQFQERLKEENFTKEQIKRRFKQTQNDCYLTFLSLLPLLTEPIYYELNVEDITKALQSKRSKSKGDQQRIQNHPPSQQAQSQSQQQQLQTSDSQPLSTIFSDDFSQGGENQSNNHSNRRSDKSKTQLWNDLKIQSLTRFLTLVYCESLLIVFLHLQLNILSRKSYLKTAIQLASETRGIKLTDNTKDKQENEKENFAEQAFLSFSWWLINRGWIDVRNKVEQTVEDTFGEITPRQELTIDEFAILISEVQLRMDRYTNENLVSLLVPEENLEFYLLQQTNDMEFLSEFNDDFSNTQELKVLLGELKGYLNDKQQVGGILNLLVTVGISKILDNFNLEKQQKVKLASYLMMVTKQSNSLLSDNSLDNDVLFTMNNLQELDDLSAGVYANF
ncbi:unnamed protein product [Ambrosiozyma monospora]|uniref:Peroxin-3 n=1 Tax=Ambrosiozyma monospora TaxID=43982 RepID=A0A9W6YVZ2_AMBMO|nr:unnamed protein product [Ambrosiozyma monospora]